MGVIRRTRASADDYREIWIFIAQDNEEAASRLLRTFDEKLTLLSQNPQAGVARPRLLKNLRSLSVGQYLLFYRPIPDGIELLRIVHGQRKLRKKMFRSPLGS